MTDEPNPRLLRVFGIFAGGAALFAVLAGVAGLTGWALDLERLRSLVPGETSMKATTAVCFVLLGSSLWILRSPDRKGALVPVARATAAAGSLIGLVVLSQYVHGFDLGIDTLTFGDQARALEETNPGRMAPNTAAAFVLAGLALALFDVRATGLAWIAPVLAGIVAALGTMALFGYASGVGSLHALGGSASMSLPGAAAFLLLGTGVLASRPNRQPVRFVVKDSMGSALFRRLLLAVVLAPVLIESVRIGERAGLYGADLGRWLVDLLLIAALLPVIWLVTRSFERSDRARQAAVEELRQAQEQWTAAFDTAPMGMALVSLDGRYMKVNYALCEMVGHSEPELVGALVATITHQEDQGSDERNLRRMIKGELVGLRTEKRYLHRDGHTVHVMLTATLVRDDAGRPQHLLAQLQDVSEQRRAEKALRESEERAQQTIVEADVALSERERSEMALRESEERYRSLVETTGEWVWQTDECGRLTYSNPAVERILGHSPEALLGRDHLELAHPDEANEFRNALGGRIARREGWSGMIIRWRHRDGTYRSLESAAVPRVDEHGEVVGFSGIDRDVTERVRGERRAAAQHAAARVIAQATTVEEATTGVLAAVCDALGWELGALWSLDEAQEHLRLAGCWASSQEAQEDFQGLGLKNTFERGAGLPGRVWESGRPLWVPDVHRDEAFARAWITKRRGLRGAFGCPVVSHDCLFGVFEFFSREPEQPDEALLSMMSAIGSFMGEFLERRRAEDELAVARERAPAVETKADGGRERAAAKAARARGDAETRSDSEASRLLDLKRIEELRRLDSRLFSRLVSLYVRGAEERASSLEDALGKGDLSTVRRAAHSLKGSSANIGANKMRELAETLEQLGYKGDLGGAPALFEELRRALGPTSEALERETRLN
jgi:PAS domain S-box-containing protein